MKWHAGVGSIVTGLVLVAVGQLVQRTIPLLGRAAYQAAAAGSYSPADYRVPLTGYYLIAVALIVLGVVLAVLEHRRGAGR